jgi:hypothetical protein
MPSDATFLEVKNAFQSIAGLESLSSADEFFLTSSLNSAVQRAYNESDSWPRYLVVGEERLLIDDQIVPYASGCNCPDLLAACNAEAIVLATSLDCLIDVPNAPGTFCGSIATTQPYESGNCKGTIFVAGDSCLTVARSTTNQNLIDLTITTGAGKFTPSLFPNPPGTPVDCTIIGTGLNPNIILKLQDGTIIFNNAAPAPIPSSQTFVLGLSALTTYNVFIAGIYGNYSEEKLIGSFKTGTNTLDEAGQISDETYVRSFTIDGDGNQINTDSPCYTLS